jgi:hypothetical protein
MLEKAPQNYAINIETIIIEIKQIIRPSIIILSTKQYTK